MAVFAILVGLEGSTYVRLPNGEWIKAWPGMSLWQDVPDSADVKDPESAYGKHLVDEAFSGQLESELARVRRERERSQ